MQQIAISTININEAKCLIFDKHNNPGITLHSIQDLLSLCNYNDIDPQSIQHLLIPNNRISDLLGIEQFSSLKELNLINNNISRVEGKTISFFHNRMRSYSSPTAISTRFNARRASFLLFMAQNRISEKTIQAILNIKEIQPEPKNFLFLVPQIVEFNERIKRQEKELISSRVDLLSHMWSQRSLYQNITIQFDNLKKESFTDYHELVRLGIYFVTDLTSETKLNHHFTSEIHNFHTSIILKEINKTIPDKDRLFKHKIYFKQCALPTLKNMLGYIESQHYIRKVHPQTKRKQKAITMQIITYLVLFINIITWWVVPDLFRVFILTLLTAGPLFLLGVYHTYRYKHYPSGSKGSKNHATLFIILAHSLSLIIDVRIYILLLPIVIGRELRNKVIVENTSALENAALRVLLSFAIPVLIMITLMYGYRYYYNFSIWNLTFFSIIQ